MDAFIAWLKQIFGLLMGRDQANTETEPLPELTLEQPPKATPTPRTEERHRVAGISYREKAALSLGMKNYDYDFNKKQLIEAGLTDERIYKLVFYPDTCELIPEPDNPEDPNAIMVVVDGVHIGYIKKGSCARVHKLLREDRIKSVSCEIGGGPYKILLTDYNEDGEEVFAIEHDTAPVRAIVTIMLKNEAR